MADFTAKSVEVDKVVGKATIADADIVVSGGRGLKGPENWGMIEELAEILGAATACSKPVSDLGWRPHSESTSDKLENLWPAISIHCHWYLWCHPAFGGGKCLQNQSGHQQRPRGPFL